MKIATILNTHQNSDVFKDTLESVTEYLSKDVMVLVDGHYWDQFENDQSINAFKLCGFRHNEAKAPFRNVALGLSKAWETWGKTVDWYCYMEYDCLVASSLVLEHLETAKKEGYWCLGNDIRVKTNKRIPIVDVMTHGNVDDLYYFLGCCLFLNSDFIEKLSENNFFERFLNFTNFYLEEISLVDQNGKKEMVYDLSEFLYPTLAVHYGGQVRELAGWSNIDNSWHGNANFYPMRFKPDLTFSDPVQDACILHPLKNFDDPIRQYYRNQRQKNVLKQFKKIAFGNSNVSGRGVFATEKINKGEIIEECPFIIAKLSELKNTTMMDYVYKLNEEECAVVLGYGFLYNHSNDPSAVWRADKNNKIIKFIALKDIEVGEEIFHCYGPEYWQTRNQKLI